VLAKVDKRAEKKGISRAEALRRMIAWALTQP